MTSPDPAAEQARPHVERYLRRQWRAGWARTPAPTAYQTIRAHSDRYLSDDLLDRALALCVQRGICQDDTLPGAGRRAPIPMIALTPRAQIVFTLVDEVLDRPRCGPDRTSGSALLDSVVAAALTADLDRALKLNPARTVEYLLRARHGTPPDDARALAAALADRGLHRPAARLVADLAPLTGTGQDACALVRTVLG